MPAAPSPAESAARRQIGTAGAPVSSGSSAAEPVSADFRVSLALVDLEDVFSLRC